MAELVDKWHAECIPCGWLTLHDVQDDAIAASCDHVVQHHPDVPAHIRGEKYIGHVQYRTVGAVAHPKDLRTVDPPLHLPSYPGDGAANLPVVVEQPPEDDTASGTQE